MNPSNRTIRMTEEVTPRAYSGIDFAVWGKGFEEIELFTRDGLTCAGYLSGRHQLAINPEAKAVL
jgi:hypothetical protein